MIHSAPVMMEPCTVDHFSASDDVIDKYSKMRGDYKLCPPLNFSSTIEGLYSTNTIKFFEIEITRCGSTFNTSVPCLNQSDLDTVFSQNGGLFADLYFVTPVINPGDADYLQYKIDD